MKRDDPLEKLTRDLTAAMARTSIEYGVLAPNDRIAVAVSGGKDSGSLLFLLDDLRRRLAFRVEVVAVHVRQGPSGTDLSPLSGWLEASGVPFEITGESTYEIVRRNARDGESPCPVCSRLRRGVLYSTAARLGCNKLALGHHLDDALATLLMNLFYGGKLQSMPPKYRTDDGRFDVIRPLVEIEEEDLRAFAGLAGFPILSCGPCAGKADDDARRRMRTLVDALAKDDPRVKRVMLGALKNVRPTHLMDRTISRGEEPT
jgi:tRNA 2-thiocytidine biosynthesis protein TtcA